MPVSAHPPYHTPGRLAPSEVIAHWLSRILDTRRTRIEHLFSLDEDGHEPSPAPDEAAEEPLLAGKYRLLQLLKEGGMGSVHVAEVADTGQKVAVKLLHEDAAANPAAVLRLYTEASAASAVGHPGIVQVLELGTDELSVPFLVMELLEGESLGEMLSRETRLDPPLAANIVAQTLSALAAAHEKGIVHRDLKPENIFITRGSDGMPIVKLLDFGISKVWRQGVRLNLTQTGTVWGTPYYMSPEHARGAKDVDGQTDIWAVGVILYQSLTGRLPYVGETYNELLAKILDESFTRPTELCPDVSKPLEQVILKALTRDRRWRYATADEFHDDLVHAIGGAGAGRWGVGSGPIKPDDKGLLGSVSRRWAAAAVVAMVVGGGVTGLALSGAFAGLGARLTSLFAPDRATVADANDETPPGGRSGPLPAGPTVLVLVDHLPPDVELRLDGRSVNGNPFTAALRTRSAVLQLLRGGAVVGEVTLVPDHDVRIDASDVLSGRVGPGAADAGSTDAQAAPAVVAGGPMPRHDASDSLVEVRVHVRPVVLDTVVRIDGDRAPNGVMRLRPGWDRRITVSAPGYRREEMRRRINADTTIEVRLIREQENTGRDPSSSDEDELPRYKRRIVDIVTEYPQ